MQKETGNIEHRIFKAQELRAAPDSRTIEGYAAVFNSESEDFGWFVEEIAPGAFDDVLGNDVRALFNHDNNLILARTTSKTLEISVDERGLKYKFEAPNTSVGNDLLESIRRGDVSQSSFGFTVADAKWEDLEMMKDGKKWFKTKRTILKLERLYDVSPVTFPAYPDTDVALRSFEARKVEASNDKTTIAIEQDRLTRALRISELKMKVKR